MSKYTLTLSLFVLLIGCKSIQLPTEKPMVSMPEKFTDTNDTLSEVKILWSDFFVDIKLKLLIQEALSNNLDLQNAMQNIEIAKANYSRAKGLLMPSVNAGTSAGVTKYGDYTQEWAGNKTTEMLPGRIIPQNLTNYYIGFVSNWELDFYGKIKDQNKSAQARFLASSEAKSWVQTNLIAMLANTYYELIGLDNQMIILKQNIALQEKSLNIVKILKEAGRGNELAINQFEAEILNAKYELNQITQSIVEFENIINTLLSRFPQPIDRIQNNLSESSLLKYRSGIPSMLLQNRPDVKMAEQELIAARFDTKIAKKEFYPSVNINAGLGLNGFSPTLLFSLPSAAYNLLGGLTAPVFNRANIKANFATASALQISALNNYQQSIVVAFTEVYNEMKNFNNLDESFQIKQQQVAKLEKAIEYADLLFQSNRANYLEVLVAQQNLLQAKLDLNELSKLQRQSSINLYKALGGGQ